MECFQVFTFEELEIIASLCQDSTGLKLGCIIGSENLILSS